MIKSNDLKFSSEVSFILCLHYDYDTGTWPVYRKGLYVWVIKYTTDTFHDCGCAWSSVILREIKHHGTSVIGTVALFPFTFSTIFQSHIRIAISVWIKSTVASISNIWREALHSCRKNWLYSVDNSSEYDYLSCYIQYHNLEISPNQCCRCIPLIKILM